MGILAKLAKARGAAAKASGEADKASKQQYPLLTELLTATKDEDGNTRDLATVSVKFQEGTWRIAVHEVNHEMSLWASAATLEDTFAALEGRLGSDDADWRAWNKPQPQKANKPRK